MSSTKIIEDIKRKRKEKFRYVAEQRLIFLQKDTGGILYSDVLDKIITKVGSLWDLNPGLGKYTLHDDQHNLYVEYYIYQIIPKEIYKKLNLREKFILLAAVWLHDIGMLPILQFDRTGNTKRFKDMTKEERAKHLHDIREKHSSFSRDYLKNEQNWKEFTDGIISKDSNYFKEFSENFEIIGEICELHTKNKSFELIQLCEEDKNWTNSNIRKPLLIAYLRLADALHISDKGTPGEVHNALLEYPDEETYYHWLKSYLTDDVIVNPLEHTLLINVITTNKIDNFLLKTSKEHKAFEIQLTNEINEELEFIKEILCECNLSYFSNIVCKRINYNEKYDFDDRELSDYYDFYMILQQIINLKYNLKKNPSSSLIISDIITTISSIIDDYDKNQNMRLKTTLSLYYKIIFKLMENRVYHALLEDFDKQLKKIENSKNDNLGENINTLSKLINTRIKERKDNIRKISKLFLKELEKVNNHNLNIILFGYSSTIIDCIDYIKQDDDFKITFYICEVRSKTQYGANNKLEFCDGLLNIEKISNITKDSSWKIFYLPDSGISNLLDRLEKNEKDSSSIVLLGVNAIDADYNVTHTMGALTVAEIASDKNIPIWIIAESSKMVIKFKDRSDRKREQKWLATDVHSLKILQNKESYNYREDTINSKYISLFITEKGVQSLHK